MICEENDPLVKSGVLKSIVLFGYEPGSAMQYDPLNHTNKHEENERVAFFVFVRVISWIVSQPYRTAYSIE